MSTFSTSFAGLSQQQQQALGTVVGTGLTFAGVGGLVGALQARSRNKAIRKAARESQRRLNDAITQVRFDRLRNTAQLARQAALTLGNVQNALPSSQSLTETLASNLVANVASDQFAIDEASRRQVEAIRAEKQAIATEASNQMLNPVTAAILGATSGFEGGMELGSQMVQRRQAEALAAAQRQTIGYDEQLQRLQLQTADAYRTAAQAQAQSWQSAQQQTQAQLGAILTQRQMRLLPWFMFR